MLKEYTLLMKQMNEGCDYTIACGKNYQFITSERTDPDDVAKDYLLDFYFGGVYDCDNNTFDFSAVDERYIFGENKLEEFFVIGDNGTHSFDLDTFHNECEMIVHNAKQAKQQSEDEAEFERLKVKLGK